MYRPNRPLTTGTVLIASLISLLIIGVEVTAESGEDPHRPACTNPRCQKIKSFVKAHYCGESPYGNGPDDGCLILRPKRPGAGVSVRADFDCEWSESKQATQCQQHGQPSPALRSIIIRELRRLGLPARDENQTYFTVWEATSAGWHLAEGYHYRAAGPSLTLCQVILVIDRSSHVRVLRKVAFQKTDADVPAVTTWSPVDLADVDGDGQLDVILEGNAYENHWLEVDSVRDLSPKTIFSGLGYYL